MSMILSKNNAGDHMRCSALGGLCAVAVWLSCPAVQAEDSPSHEHVEHTESDGHDHDGEHHDEEHGHGGHDGGHHGHGGHGGVAHQHDHRFELGLAPGLAYLVEEEHFTAGLHLHLIAALGESRWGLGLGFERLLDEHSHNTAGVVLQYRLTNAWSMLVSPGLTFEDSEPSELEPSVHIESTYEFFFGDYHLGPSLEYAADAEDSHVTLGVHVAVGF